VLTVGVAFYNVYAEGRESGRSRQRFQACLQSDAALTWLREFARAEANKVEAGKIPVVTDDFEINLKYNPVHWCLGTGGLVSDFPWDRLGLKSGIVRAFQLQKMVDGTCGTRREVAIGAPVDAILIGDPYRWGVIVVTANSLNEKCKESVGWPHVHWSGDMGVWYYIGHPR
jgi:hypothetical protein